MEDGAGALAPMDRDRIIKLIMDLSDGLGALLTPERRILAVNHSLLESFGIETGDEILGMPYGEALGCLNAQRGPDGCGSSSACASCGTVLAVMQGLSAMPGSEKPQQAHGRGPAAETRFILKARKPTGLREYCFRVRAAPVDLGDQLAVALFMRDVTEEERRAALERVFFHDVGNLVAALQSAAFLAGSQEEEVRRRGLSELGRLSNRLSREMSIQRALVRGEAALVGDGAEDIDHGLLLRELGEFARNHPAGRGKRLILPEHIPETSPRTDFAYLLRVLSNMVLNALEAVQAGQDVSLEIRESDDFLRYMVSNPGVIPEEIQPRIFERHFSTKGGFGRGLGTYSMKLLGEECMGGRVGFLSGPKGRTSFWIDLPLPAH
jgi:signal transduction histidine kinase